MASVRKVRPKKPKDARAEGTDGDDGEEPDWAREIKRKLEEKVSLDFSDTPLRDVVKSMGELCRTKIVLDAELEEETAAKPVTLKVTDIRASLALDRITRLADLRYVLRDGKVVLTGLGDEGAATDEAADAERVTAPHARLVGEFVLVGAIDAHELRVLTTGGAVELEPERISIMGRPEDDANDGRFTFRLVDGSSVTGRLEAGALPVRLSAVCGRVRAGDLIFRVPARQLLEWRGAKAPESRNDPDTEEEADDEGGADLRAAKRALSAAGLDPGLADGLTDETRIETLTRLAQKLSMISMPPEAKARMMERLLKKIRSEGAP